MATRIDYCDETLNYVTGCTKVSPACKNCYAEVMTKRLKGMGQKKYAAGFDEVVEHWDMLDFKFPRKSTRYFVNSMSDTFHKDVSFNFQYEMFKKFANNPQHTFLIFTKRAEIASQVMPKIWFHLERNGYKVPLENVWLIVTVENQETADERIPYLINTPARIRAISAEPLLGFIDFSKYINDIDLIIVGGESGTKARPTHPCWIDFIQSQCHTSKTPFWFKQHGTWQAGSAHHLKPEPKHIVALNDGRYFDYETAYYDIKKLNLLDTEYSKLDPHVMAKVGKKKSGDMLDGKQRKEWPNITRKNTNGS